MKEKSTILIVDDTPANIRVLLDTLDQQEYHVLVAKDGESAIEHAQHGKPELILLDVMMPGISGFETCQMLKKNASTREIPIIFMTSLSEVDDKLKGFEVGAVDYITKPFHAEEVISRISTHLTLRRLQDKLGQMVKERTAELSKALKEVEILKNRLEKENAYLQEEIKLTHNFEEIITQNKEYKKMLASIEQVAATNATVLILGESGTGKELLARAVHNRSKVASNALVKVNCAALPENLIESELFGHEKGAFTGAITQKQGRFELADGGTIFLDEIGDLPLALQSKLLRVLQEREFERLGNPRTIKVNVRVVAATNKDLKKAVSKGKFREDLYYRLNVFPITSSPLRERSDDIPLLAQHFCQKYNRLFGKNVSSIPQSVMGKLQSYDWPGNVRELENIIERAVITSRGKKLEVINLDIAMSKKATKSSETMSFQHNQRAHIVSVLKHTNWKVSGADGAAQMLGLNPKTLYSKMKKLGIRKGAGG